MIVSNLEFVEELPALHGAACSADTIKPDAPTVDVVDHYSGMLRGSMEGVYGWKKTRRTV